MLSWVWEGLGSHAACSNAARAVCGNGHKTQGINQCFCWSSQVWEGLVKKAAFTNFKLEVCESVEHAQQVGGAGVGGGGARPWVRAWRGRAGGTCMCVRGRGAAARLWARAWRGRAAVCVRVAGARSCGRVHVCA